MNNSELIDIIRRGEDSKHQFKRIFTNIDAIAAEMVAFSNTSGGLIIIGINDNGTLEGLSADDIQKLNNLISNAASQNVIPAINPLTQNVSVDDKLVMVVEIPNGINKPYQDKNGVFWVKSGADKRKATSIEEIQRLFQKSGLIHADEMTVSGLTGADLDFDYFKNFFFKHFGKPFEEETLPVQKLLENMNLLKDDMLTLAGALLFANQPQFKLPAFIVKAGAFNYTDISTSEYQDSRNIEGKLGDIFNKTISFVLGHLRHVQGEQGFNSIGIPEIPLEALEEIVTNALIHRDYFISSPVRVFVFRDRVEIISPGHLPNNLTIENIKAGNSNTRNPVLASFANYLLPYRGYGSGIIRALSKYPEIDFADDRENNQFKVTFRRIE